MINSQVISGFILDYGLKILVSLLAVFIGFRVIKWMVNLLEKRMVKRNLDPTIINFTIPFTSLALKIGVIMSVIPLIGFKLTSFVAVIGGASFAVGLAFQGSLSNFAGGILLLTLKPFGVGDFIEVGSYKGKVKAISVFYTYLNTFDNKLIVIPNSKVSNDSLINYTANDIRRIDLVIGVDYNTKIDYMKETLLEVVRKDDDILNVPDPIIGLGEYGDSSINFHVKVWVKTENYWNVFYRFNENIKRTFDDKGIEFPFPHLDVNIYKDIKKQIK